MIKANLNELVFGWPYPFFWYTFYHLIFLCSFLLVREKKTTVKIHKSLHRKLMAHQIHFFKKKLNLSMSYNIMYKKTLKHWQTWWPGSNFPKTFYVRSFLIFSLSYQQFASKQRTRHNGGAMLMPKNCCRREKEMGPAFFQDIGVFIYPLFALFLAYHLNIIDTRYRTQVNVHVDRSWTVCGREEGRYQTKNSKKK